MPNETEAMALALLRLLYDAKGGEPRRWQTVRRLDGATDDAIRFAQAHGWIQVDDGRGIALTLVGHQLAEDLAQPLQ